jgi:alpha-1,3-rhamnosyl/mannosyltransferase
MTMYRESIYWEPNYILQEFDGISIPTIYDLSHVRYPEFHPAQRRRWLDDNLMSSLERATAIITISEFSKKEIINHFSIKKEKISVISPAVADDFRYPYNTQEKAEMRQFYSLPSTFILSVGTLEPRKNIKGLLSAFKSLPEPLKNAFPLVVVGCAGWLSEDVEQIMQPMIKRGQVIRLGYVRQQHLPILFSAASLFVYVSHYEGYGMPIAEAMCSGVPVITSNISSMPEVAAGCAKLVNPNNTDEIASEIQELLENTQVRGQLVELAKQKSDSYLWGNSAKKLVDVLQKQRT